MAQIILTIPDAVVVRARDAACLALGYQATINGASNPETKAQFIQRKLAEYLKTLAKEGEALQAAATARDSVETQISIT
jgi:hypothetical protein